MDLFERTNPGLRVIPDLIFCVNDADYYLLKKNAPMIGGIA